MKIALISIVSLIIVVAMVLSDPPQGIGQGLRFILIPNVNAWLHRFFCLGAVSLLSQRSSAAPPFDCCLRGDKTPLC